MEQLVWAIIIIIFIIFTALKNRARNKPKTPTDRTSDTEHQTEEERDKLAGYMEELFGIETPETKPQVRVERKEPKPLEKRVRTKPEPKVEKKIGQFESPLTNIYEKKPKPPIPEKKDIYRARLPWDTLSGKDLKNAIIFAEILGPPISKRKSHRLF
jgi:FtsZ-interacting cell division protein ZipA